MALRWEKPLEELAQYQGLLEAWKQKKSPIAAGGCTDSQKIHLAQALAAHAGWTLYITESEQKAAEAAQDWHCFRRDVYLYPARDLLFYSSDIHGNLLTRQRMEVVRHLLQDRQGVVVTSVDALAEKMLPAGRLPAEILRLRAGDTLDMKETAARLSALGYEREPQVEAPGQFSVRGGILDIFPLTEEVPVRLELWGDEVDSIRSFDPDSQRSVEELEAAEIFPASEIVLTREEKQKGIERLEAEKKRCAAAFRKEHRPQEAWRLEQGIGEITERLQEGAAVHGLESLLPYFTDDLVSFLDYFSGEDTAVFADEPVRLRERLDGVLKEFADSAAGRIAGGGILPGQQNCLFGAGEIAAALNRAGTVMLSALDQRVPGVTPAYRASMETRSLNSYKGSFNLLIEDLTRWKKEKYRVILLAGSTARAARLAGDLRGYDLHAFCPDEEEREVLPGEIMVLTGSLHRGFVYPMIRFAVITEGDMFGKTARRKRQKSGFSGKAISRFAELSVGDYVVHENHGLGIYQGIEKMVTEDGQKDYIKIAYRDDGVLYIPASRLDRIQKYAGGAARGEKGPKLSRLGSPEWNRTKNRVRGEVKEIAKELLRLYARRQAAAGVRYGPDTAWQREFEEAFPFEETEDQLKAIEDTKKDMESGVVMDRLICGDVGYGKTEIAIRAAFKAVQDGRQVAVLVPTTILAQQHYNTFTQRMKDYPVNIGMLSRFRTAREQKETLNKLKKGQMDIIIGTHRLLSADVQFRNLGLLVVDEEQRFGVSHKEKIKKLRANVDVLTLSATPIPRTLHMSLAGIRDMSVLEEAPMERQPIQTYVMEYSDEVIREAIHREMSRGGQVYYVYNRVNHIADIAERIKKLVPEAEVVYAHGQMHERELEQVMLDFVNGEIDVLVSTTIIETGLDIPNANTIIIHDADRLGLSQLYQIRGRVGRTNRTAYAFLLYRRDKILREEAEKRLQAIRDFTELGSGIRIAMRDLEIRGAGNVLGAKQSGHMEEIGYDLYCKLLNQAVQSLKGIEEMPEDFETEVNCDINAYIPSSYIKNESQKLDIYKRISGFADRDDRMDMLDELTDRFGEPPKTVQNLLQVAELKAMAARVGVTVLTIEKQQITLQMYPKAKLDAAKIPGWIALHQNKLRFRTGEKPAFVYTEQGRHFTTPAPMMEIAAALLTEMEEQLLMKPDGAAQN